MIFKPTNISPSNVTTSLSEENTISWKNNGDIMVRFVINLYNNVTNTLIYTSGQVSSTKPTFSLPANVVKVGTECKFNITVYNSSGESATSDMTIVRLFKRPVLSVQTDGYMRNQRMYIRALYSHPDRHKPKYYQASLYDQYGKLIERGSHIYTDMEIYEHEFAHILDNATIYKVEVVASSQFDLLGSTGLVSIESDYEKSVLNLGIETRTYDLEPFVEIEWSTVRIVGHGSNYTVNNGSLDVTNGYVLFDENFSTEQEFSFTVKFKRVATDKNLVELMGSNSSYIITYHNNKFHLYLSLKGKIVSHFQTKIISFNESVGAVVTLVQKSGRITFTYEGA